jgi:aspartyl-tRNA(Asn)/glutamyl-tRNA(Gln) amidotransferase subunit A
MELALTGFDALLTPTAPTTAYKFGETSTDPLEMYKGDLMTVNVNLAGLPAVVVPCAYVGDGHGSRLPMGLQIIGHAFGEASLLEIAHIFEQTHVFERPPLAVA